MRKNSIKALSLVLCLLLVLPMLLSAVWAETEVPGDLNGVAQVTQVIQADIDALEAALRSGQLEDNVNYDISGNRIVDSDDLVVLKNLVDPENNPALADKLADGTTDDLLNLVSAVEGGELQRAIVRGNSTRALKAEGNTITITFAQAQNWSGKTTLEMDVLWTTDKRTFTVTLLGVTEKAVTVKGNASQWGTVSVPVAGIVGEGVTGIRITVSDGAEAYFDNFAIYGETSASSVTRKNLEKALMEVAWAYHLKGSSVQYDSTEFNTRGTNGSDSPLSKDYGGPWRTNTFSTLEDATADFNLYSVCSDYCWNVYYEALGYPILGNRINAVTAGLFYNTAYPQNMAVLRWWDSGISSTVKDRLKDYNNGVMPTPTHTADETFNFFNDWENNLRPGDIIVMHGNGGHQHAMLYVGNGTILHCGGGKFNMSTGKDSVEENGAILLATVDGTFIGNTEQGGYFSLTNGAGQGPIADDNDYGAWLVVVRPLDVLTVADGDTDPSNDKLNTDYVLDVGELELTLGNNDLNPVPTTGFGITDTTASRLQFPGMNIERTVDVKNYGTVAQGGQLTYTIKITNNSDNTTAYSEAKAYSSLKVTETIPANTTYVSNVGGGTYANGKISWTVNVSAGSSVELTYTVKVTGAKGDKIVNGGGYVANIPSNVLTTTIGGQKLEGTDASFVNKEASDWNSNAGNKLSANAVDGTSFAERVYNEWAGLDLELPTVQELAAGMFTEFKLYQPYGLHTNHDKSLTRYMYKLNSADEVVSEMRIYRNMLVDGYFGGVWVHSNDYNNEPRIIDPNVKYLEAGDILVYMNLKGSVSGGLESEERKVTSWRVLVYLGNDTFASLDSDKQMVKAIGNAAVVEALSYDMFLVLRPSQAYADINSEVKAYTKTAPSLGAEDMLVGRKAPDGKPLGDTAKGSIAVLEADGKWNSANLTFATEVYAAVNLDIYTGGIAGRSYAGMLLGCFVEKTTWFGWSQGYILAEEAPEGYEGLYEMITHYGGGEFYSSAGADLTSLGALEVGDVIVMGNRSYSAYLTAVYQGGGKFLIARRQYSNVVGGEGVYQNNTYAQETVTNISTFLNQYINSDVNTSKKYTGYIVLRPSKAYDDLNKNAVRNMLDGQLTGDEKNALASLTQDDWLYGGRNLSLSGFAGWAYRSVGVELGSILQDKTVTGARNTRFIESGGRMYLNTPLHASYDPYYAAMMLPDCGGGSLFGENAGRTLSADALEVGDIFAAAKKDPDAAGEYVYRVALYQGNGQFLIAQWNYRSEGKAWISTTEIIGEDYSNWLYYYVLRPDAVHTEFLLQDATLCWSGEETTLDIREIFGEMPGKGVPSQWETSDPNVAKVENGELVVVGAGECTITATGETHTASCLIRVVREITTGALTAEEKTAIENYTVEDLTTGLHLNVIAGNAYDAAGIDISKVITGSTNDIRKLFMEENCTLKADPKEELVKMLVPGYYGGSKNSVTSSATNKTFVTNDFKVGDLFCAFSKTTACIHGTGKGWKYYTGVYQGDGKFLVSCYAGSCADCHGIYEDIYSEEGAQLKDCYTSIWSENAADLNNAYLFYFVLRPERLASDALQSISLSDATVEKNATTTLSVTKDPEGAAPNATVTWRSSDETVATVDANGVVTGVKVGTATITAYCDGYSASCTVTVTARSITTGALTPEEMAAFAGFTASKTTLSAVAGEAYTRANITGIYELLGRLHSGNIRKQVLNDDGTVITTETSYTKMLVPGYYGGAKYKATTGSSGKTFKPEDLKPGDLFGAVILSNGPVCEHCTKNYDYISAVYLGDETFYVVSQYCTSCTGYLDKKGEAITTEATAGHSRVSLWTANAADLEGLYGYYFVLRPERLAPDALQSISLNKADLPLNYFRSEDMVLTGVLGDKTEVTLDASKATWTSSNTAVATVDENGKVTGVAEGSATITVYYEGYSASCTVTVSKRNITSGALTADEMAAISNITTTDIKWWRGVGVNVYGIAGINVEIFSTTASPYNNFNNFRKTLFDNNGALIDGTSDYHKMLIPGYYGGKKNAATSSATNKTFVPNDLKVGDMLCTAINTACEHSKWRYITAVYQGNGKFLVVQYANGCSTCSMVYEDVYGEALTNGLTSLWSDAATLNTVFDYYFVLRPERLAADALQSISLNEPELDLYRKSKETLTVTTDAGVTVDATKATWVSSNEAVATVDANGQITGESAGTAVITAYYEGYSASCEVTVDSKRLITSGALTAEEQAAFAGFTASKSTLSAVAGEAYTRANITGIYELLGMLHSGNIRKQVLNDDGTVITTVTSYTKMLVPGYYGGAKYKATTGSSGKTFKPEDLKPGDLFGAVILSNGPVCEHCTKNYDYISAVYLGDETFYVVSQYCTSCTGYLDKKGEAITTEATAGHSRVSLWTANAADLEGLYGYYFVLRPERLADDALQSITLNGPEQPLDFSEANSLPKANAATLSYETVPAAAAAPTTVIWSTSNPDVATVDQNGNITAVGAGTCTITVNCDGYKATCEVTITRSIEARTTLTATEQAAISVLNEEDLSIANPGPVAYDAYLAVGIDISAVLEKQSFNSIRDSVFAATESDYTKMLMPGYYGGYSKKTGRTFVREDMKVGDIFCATYGRTTCDHGKYQYVTAIYQGEGKFLVVHYANGCTDNCSSIYIDQDDVELTNGKISIWSDTATEMETFQYYFILRPERLGYREITEGALTQEEMSAIAGYNRTEQGGTLAEVVEDAYAEACIYLDPITSDSGVSAVRKMLISEENDETVGLLIERETVWHQMLVDGCYGGAYNARSTAPTNKTFARTDFQIGDVFCAITKCVTENEDGTKTTTWPATTAIYVGNGRFVVSVHATCDCIGTYIDDVAQMTDGNTPDGHTSIWASEVDALNNSWLHYFVLRPSQLAQ